MLDPLYLKSMVNLAVARFFGTTSSSHMKRRSLNNSSLISGQFLNTAAGTPSGPKALPLLRRFTAESNSARVTGSHVFSKGGRSGRRCSSGVAANLSARKFPHVAATSSGDLRRLPSLSEVRLVGGRLGLFDNLLTKLKIFLVSPTASAFSISSTVLATQSLKSFKQDDFLCLCSLLRALFEALRFFLQSLFRFEELFGARRDRPLDERFGFLRWKGLFCSRFDRRTQGVVPDSCNLLHIWGLVLRCVVVGALWYLTLVRGGFWIG